MAITIQICNAPDALHRRLKSRAALAGMSLSAYLLSEIRDVAERPTLAELRKRLETRSRITPSVTPARRSALCAARDVVVNAGDFGTDAAGRRPSRADLLRGDIFRVDLIAAERSYQHFIALSSRSLLSQSAPQAHRRDRCLTGAAAVLCGQVVDLVAVDMPLARSAIVGRPDRTNEVSRALSAQMRAYTPSVLCPAPERCADRRLRQGRISATHGDDRDAGIDRGRSAPRTRGAYGCCGAAAVQRHREGREPTGPRYDLGGARASISSGGRDAPPRSKARSVGSHTALPKLESNAGVADMKAYEDMVDHITCAWVGVCGAGRSGHSVWKTPMLPFGFPGRECVHCNPGSPPLRSSEPWCSARARRSGAPTSRTNEDDVSDDDGRANRVGPDPRLQSVRKRSTHPGCWSRMKKQRGGKH